MSHFDVLYRSMFECFLGPDLKAYFKNMKAQSTTLTLDNLHPDSYFRGAFLYVKSPEGHEFWYDKAVKWEQFRQNPPKLFKFLAGIDHEN